jgi:hypothetical protein
MKYYTVEEVTVDGYVSILNFKQQKNAETYITDNPNLNLEGPNERDTADIYFED